MLVSTKLYVVYFKIFIIFTYLSFLNLDTIEKEIRKIFNIPDEKETRLWNKYMSNTFEPLNKPDSTIQDAGLYQGQVLFSSTVYFKHTVRETFWSHKLYGYPDNL